MILVVRTKHSVRECAENGGERFGKLAGSVQSSSFASHILSLGQSDGKKSVRRAVSRSSTHLNDRRSQSVAKEALERALRMIEITFDPDQPTTTIIRDNLESLD